MDLDSKIIGRKRKAPEAEISQLVNSNKKRVKLSFETDPSNTTNTNTDSFAFTDTNTNTSFSSLLQSEATKNTSSKQAELSPSATTSKSPEIHVFSDKLQQQNTTDSNPTSNWSGSNNNNDFGTFESAVNFDFNDLSTTKPTNEKFETVSKQTEFKFDANTSNFTVDELTSKSSNNNNNTHCDDVEYEDKPIAELKGKIDSGDSNDDNVFSLKCMIYEFDVKNKEYKEKGIGDVHLNTYRLENEGKVLARLLCRKDVTFKKLMNAMVQKDTKFDRVNGKTLRFTVFEQIMKKKSEDKDEDDDDDDVVFNVTKSYLLKSKDNNKKMMDTLMDKIKVIQKEM